MRALQGGSSSATDNWFCKRPHPSISALHGMCRFLSRRNCAVSCKKADLPGFSLPGNRAAERPLFSGKSQKNWVGQDARQRSSMSAASCSQKRSARLRRTWMFWQACRKEQRSRWRCGRSRRRQSCWTSWAAPENPPHWNRAFSEGWISSRASMHPVWRMSGGVRR